MNIFNYIVTNRVDNNSTDFHLAFIERLSSLLEFSCQISKDMLTITDGSLFQYNDNASSKKRFIYHFHYNGELCYVVILVDDKSKYCDQNVTRMQTNYYSNINIANQRLLVIFKFPISHIPKTMPMQTNTVSIAVCENMEFLSAKFERRFDLNWNLENSPKSYLQLTRSSVVMYKIMNELKETKTFLEYFDDNTKSVIFDSSTVSQLYFNNDVHFETSFLKMMNFLENNPVLFASTFPDYPTLVDFSIEGIETFRYLADRFSSDYLKDSDYLNDSLLLFDMALI